jgi:hypothetical protein
MFLVSKGSERILFLYDVVRYVEPERATEI